MPPKRASTRRSLLSPPGERGAALPLALFGLVAVSLLVTSALLTSSTEVVVSRAHLEGTRSLHAANAALEQFVAERAAMADDRERRFENGEFPTMPPTGGAFVVQVAELARGEIVDLPQGGVRRTDTYALIARPQDGRGRSVGALLETTRTALPAPPEADSAGGADSAAVRALAAGALDASPQIADSPTFAWFEVVR